MYFSIKTYQRIAVFVAMIAVFTAPSVTAEIPGDIAEPYGQVDEADLTTLADWWLISGCSEPDYCGGADMSGTAGEADGIVNLHDFAVFTDYWLEGVIPGDIAEPFGQVDAADLMAMTAWWMVTICDSLNHCFGADMSGPSGIPDGTVNLYDFAMLASNWLEGTETQP